MRVTKNINNNVSLCIDENNKEAIVFGKGIGTKKPPYKIHPSEIQRIFYDIDANYVQMLSKIPEIVLNIASEAVDYGKRILKHPLRSNVMITLADHLNFAITRYKEKEHTGLIINEDIKQLFEKEIMVGYKTLSLIKKELQIELPEEEAAFIAMHLINAEIFNEDIGAYENDDKIIQKIVEIIEDHFNIEIDIDGINYSRFVSHMHYLIKRCHEKDFFESDNNMLYDSLVKSFPNVYQCCLKIMKFINETLSCNLTDEETIYLIIHINRLCSREDCYQ